MTKARSYPDDNGGLCEDCNRPETKHAVQMAAPVFLGGGIGQGTLWLCTDCLKARKAREATDRASETRE